MRHATDTASLVFPHGFDHAPRFEDLRSTSIEVCRLLDAAQREVDTMASLLLCGEPGTGKATLARAIHAAHRFPGRPFVHSFLGAASGTAWFAERIHDAQRGTLFVHGLALAPSEVRHGMLVALERGLHEDLQVRIVTASTRSLDELASNSSLIEPELLQRLSQVVLDLPPLRRRGDDIVPAFEAALAREALRLGREPFGRPSSLVQRTLASWPWPANFHGLLASARHAAAAAKGTHVSAEDLGLCPEDAVTALHALSVTPEFVADQRLSLVIGALVQANGNVVEAARALDVSKSTLYVWVQQMGLDPRMFRLRRRRA